MKISIDTKADSKEEIRKAIKLLVGLVGAQDVYTHDLPLPAAPEPKQTNIFESPNPPVGNLMSMFDSEPSTPPLTQQETEPSKKDEDIPQLEFY